jgi:hypothetical protein
LVFCEEVNLHYKLIDANHTTWRFGGDSDPQETGHWRVDAAVADTSCARHRKTEALEA